MTSHQIHEGHAHAHGPQCGHPAIQHDGHTDYAHGGHLHHAHEDHVDEHTLAVGGVNPSACTPAHSCAGHPTDHRHGETCGHAAIPHGDHVDYLIAGHLHHPHTAHCDDHGVVQLG